MSLATKYRPKTLDDVVEQSMVVSILKNMLACDNVPFRSLLFIGNAGCGKAQPLTSKILTPNGFISMGEVTVGTEVYTDSGCIGDVIGIYPQGHRPIYEILLDDDCRIQVSDEHLNCVYSDISVDPKYYVLTTMQLIDKFKDTALYVKTPDVPGARNLPEYREIISIEYIHDDICQCIMIDHPDHTYISDGFIPTHNTTIARCIANYLNDNKGGIIEVDAASNNGADSVRSLVDQAQAHPIGTPYKVFILDECFHRNTLVSTLSGKRPISDVRPGDLIYNMTGVASVSRVLTNSVKTENLTLVYVNGSAILTTKDHLFFTSDGWVKAQDLVEGDILYDNKTMRSLWKAIPDIPERQSQNLRKEMLRDTAAEESACLQSEARKNRVRENVSSMWKNLLHVSVDQLKYVFTEVCSYLQEATRSFSEADRTLCFAQAGIYLSSMREAYDHPEERSSEILFQRMFGEGCFDGCTRYPTTREILCDMWKYVYPEVQDNSDLFKAMPLYINRNEAERTQKSSSFQVHEATQPYEKSRSICKNESYKDEERHMVYALCSAWRQWTFYQASDASSPNIRKWMGLRVSCENRRTTVERDALSYELQTRPCLAGKETWNRGGWGQPQYEISTVIRSEESNMLGEFRVDSVEVFKRGCNEQSFRRYFSDSELSKETVEMYDLEVNGHPSYFVEDVLVHNCHSFSNVSWQVWLKCLEEPPAKSIFLFCTTNPEKIPETILSRVQTFRISKISVKGIHDRLAYVIDQENAAGRNITYTDDALNFIAKLANGGMRDSLTLLDKALAYNEDINSQNLQVALNLPNYDDFFELLGAYAKRDNKTITEVINRVYNSGVNFITWFQSFHSFVVNIMKYIFLQDINETLIPAHYQEKLSKYTAAHSMVCMKLANKLVSLNNELRNTQYLQEIALTYLCQPAKKV